MKKYAFLIAVISVLALSAAALIAGISFVNRRTEPPVPYTMPDAVSELPSVIPSAEPEHIHEWASEKQFDENQHWQVCRICGETRKHADHIIARTALEKASPEKDGVFLYKCAACGYQYTGPFSYDPDLPAGFIEYREPRDIYGNNVNEAQCYFILNPDGKSYSVSGGRPNWYTFDDKTFLATVIPSEYAGLPVTGIGDGYGFSLYLPGNTNSIKGDFNVEIEEGIQRIGSKAFCLYSDDANMVPVQLIIPSTVTEISPDAFFSNGDSFKPPLIRISEDNPKYASDGKCIYEKGTGRMILSLGSDGNVASDKNVSVIGKGSVGLLSPGAVVTIGKNVKEIEPLAFTDFSRIAEVTAEEGGNFVCGNAGGWYILEKDTGNLVCCSLSVRLDDIPGLRSVGGYVFGEKPALTGDVVIPATVERISDHAFEGATVSNAVPNKRAKLLLLGDSCYIGEYAFAGSDFYSVSLPDGVGKIGEGTFSGCKYLADLTIPSGCREIGSRAFEGCAALEKIVLPDGVERVGGFAFRDCPSLRTLTIGKNVNSIEDGAFALTSSLESVSVAEGNASFRLVTGCLIDVNRAEIVIVCNGADIPDDPDVRRIAPKIFAGRRFTRSQTVPARITEIGERAFDGAYIPSIVFEGDEITIKDSAFACCSGITGIRLPGRTVLGTAVFEGCPDIERVVLPSTLVEVPAFTFSGCLSLKEAALPATLTKIGEFAFSGAALTEVIIPDGVVSVGEGAFRDCSSLRRLHIGAGTLLTEEDGTRWGSFSGAGRSLSEISVSAGNSRYSTNETVLVDKARSSVILGSSSALIPGDGSVIRIAQRAFRECSGLETLDIPDVIEEIGRNAFEGCSSFRSVTLPKGLKTVDLRIFGSTVCFKRLIIPDGAEKLVLGSRTRASVEGAKIFLPNSVKSLFVEKEPGTESSSVSFYYAQKLSIVYAGGPDEFGRIECEGGRFEYSVVEFRKTQDYLNEENQINDAIAKAILFCSGFYSDKKITWGIDWKDVLYDSTKKQEITGVTYEGTACLAYTFDNMRNELNYKVRFLRGQYPERSASGADPWPQFFGKAFYYESYGRCYLIAKYYENDGTVLSHEAAPGGDSLVLTDLRVAQIPGTNEYNYYYRDATATFDLTLQTGGGVKEYKGLTATLEYRDDYRWSVTGGTLFDLIRDGGFGETSR